jgi:hypothetical protein
MIADSEDAGVNRRPDTVHARGYMKTNRRDEMGLDEYTTGGLLSLDKLINEMGGLDYSRKIHAWS